MIIKCFSRLFLLVSLSSVVAGCGDGDGSGDKPDGGEDGGEDGGGQSAKTCNPVEQTGCDDGKKCAVLQVTDESSRIACVSEGTKGEGELCTIGMVGAETGFDDCEGGYDCNTTCQKFCSLAGMGMDGPGQGTCSTLGNMLPGVCVSDPYLQDNAEFENGGLCEERCTLPAGSECTPIMGHEVGCYQIFSTVPGPPQGTGVQYDDLYSFCALGVAPESNPNGSCGGQDCKCGGEGDNQQMIPCGANWCAAGFFNAGVFEGTLDKYRETETREGRLTPKLTLPRDGSSYSCVKACSPHAGFLAGTDQDDANGRGDASGIVCDSGYECRYLASFRGEYLLSRTSNFSIPDTVGVCLKTSDWDTCKRNTEDGDTADDLDPRDLWKATMFVVGETGVIELEAIDRFIPGCHTYDEMLQARAKVARLELLTGGGPSGKNPGFWQERIQPALRTTLRAHKSGLNR